MRSFTQTLQSDWILGHLSFLMLFVAVFNFFKMQFEVLVSVLLFQATLSSFFKSFRLRLSSFFWIVSLCEKFHSLIHNCKLVNLFGFHLTVSLLQGYVIPFLLCLRFVFRYFTVTVSNFDKYGSRRFNLFVCVFIFIFFPLIWVSFCRFLMRGCIPFWIALKVSS